MADIKSAAEVCKSQRIPANSDRFKACEAFVEQCNEQVKAGKSTFTLMTTKGAYPEQKSAAACFISAKLAAIGDHLPAGFKPTEQPATAKPESSQPATKEELKTPKKDTAPAKEETVAPSNSDKGKNKVTIEGFEKTISSWGNKDIWNYKASNLQVIDVNANGFFELGVDRLFSKDERNDVKETIVAQMLHEHCASKLTKGFLFSITPRAEKKIKELTAITIDNGNGYSYHAAEFKTYKQNGQTCQILIFPSLPGGETVWDSCNPIFGREAQACTYFNVQPKIDYNDLWGQMTFTFVDENGSEWTVYSKPKY